MSRRNCVEVKLDLEVDVVTAGFAADLVTAIIEYLLYQRNQIPFVFPTFKNLISRWKPDEEEDDVFDYMLEKQRSLARNTLNGISALILVLRQQVKRSRVSSIRLFFGATIATPREVYTIKLPEISRNHSPENHRIPVDPLIRKLLMSLVTSEDLYKVFSLHLPTTNMFVDLEVLGGHTDESENFFPKEYFDIPPRCTSVVINLNHQKKDNVALNCCHEIEVFQDMANVSLSEEKPTPQEDRESELATWWEANCYVRGYKDVPMRGKFLWQADQRASS